ncbi:MAG: hypothetical protein CMH57_08075 [Myxococcales bacterium]|nr:hypothetical protein [Myxococcales bacterium]
MDGYIIEAAHTISPFQDPVSACRVEDRPLSEWVERTLRDLGCDAVRPAPNTIQGPALVMTGDLWITRDLATAFLKEARSKTTPTVLAARQGLMTSYTEVLQDLGECDVDGEGSRVYPLAWVPAGASLEVGGGDLALEWEALGLTPLAVELDEDPMELPVHRVFAAEQKLVLPFTHRSAVRIGHWMHVLRANQMARIGWGARLVRVEWLKLLWAAMRAMSFNKWRVMAKLTTRGAGCDIHPTAVVEGSVLGDNVTVGAGAIVRFSWLGDGARVSDSSHVLYSVLGAGASTARMGMLQSCVLYPGANSGHYGLQLCVVGRDTFVGGEVVLGDFKPDGNIMVMHRGELKNTHTNLLGCAVGHDCSVMMRATTYAGREIPNGYTIIGPPHDIITKIPDGLPRDGTPLIADGGVLVPYSKARHKRRAPGEEG